MKVSKKFHSFKVLVKTGEKAVPIGVTIIADIDKTITCLTVHICE